MARPKLVIGNKNYSSWSFRAWLVLTKAGVAFDEVPVSLGAPDYKATLLAHSPTGRVPVYREGELVIWDSLAIAEYVAEDHPSLWPSDRQARAEARAIAAEMHAGFGALRAALPMNCRATGREVALTPEVQSDVERIVAIWERCLERPRDGDWLFGGFSIADAMFAPVVSRFRTYGIPAGALADVYCHAVLDDADVRAWYAAALAEEEILAEEEVGG